MYSPLEHASSAFTRLWNIHPQHVLTLEHASSACTHSWTCILSMYSPLEHASSAFIHHWNMHPQHVLASGTCIFNMYSPLEHVSSACTHIWNMHPQYVLTSGTCILSMYWLMSSKLFMYSSWFLVDWAMISCARKKRHRTNCHVTLRFLHLGVRNGVIHLFFIHNLL